MSCHGGLSEQGSQGLQRCDEFVSSTRLIHSSTESPQCHPQGPVQVPAALSLIFCWSCLLPTARGEEGGAQSAAGGALLLC